MDNAQLIEAVQSELIEERLGLTRAEVVDQTPAAQSAPQAQGRMNPETERVSFEWKYFWDQYAQWVTKFGRVYGLRSNSPS